MQKTVTYLLPLIAIIAAFVSYSFCRKVNDGIYPELPTAIRTLETFNNFKCFVQDTSSPRTFRYKGRQTPEAYLRFAIPDFTPRGYTLTLRLRARQALLESSYLRFAHGRAEGRTIHGDTATYVIRMKDPEQFVWTNGKCYVGVGFPSASLREGDIVELVDFKFSYNLQD